MNIEEIVNKLLSGTHTLIFKKVSDDSIRRMTCTLSKEVIQQKDHAKVVSNLKEKKVLPVWDIEKNAWRSFRIDRLIRFEEDENEE